MPCTCRLVIEFIYVCIYEAYPHIFISSERDRWLEFASYLALEQVHHLAREAAARLRGAALHEEHHGRGGDEPLQPVYVFMCGPIRSN